MEGGSSLTDMVSQIQEYLSNGEQVAMVLAALASIAGGLVSALAKTIQNPKKEEGETDFEQSHDLVKDTRLDELKSKLSNIKWVRTLNSASANFLTFGQYIIGGLLASSFIQESLSKNMIGLLGVLVLFSSLVHQRFRPDIQAEWARMRVAKARKMIREIEDRIFELKNERDGAQDIFSIRNLATNALSALDDAELESARELRRVLDDNNS
jgi:hypothetical protein